MGRVGRILSAFYIKGDVKGLKKECGMSSTTAKFLSSIIVVTNWALLPLSLILAIWNIKLCNEVSKDRKALRKLILFLANDENASFILELLKKNEGDIIYTLFSDEEMAKNFLNISGMKEKLSEVKRLNHFFKLITENKVDVPELQLKQSRAHIMVTYV
jgi:hypothetical protein